MSFTTACSCGARFQVRQELLGTQVFCPTCGKRFIAKQAPTLRYAKTHDDDSIKVSCECGRAVRVAAKYFGKRITCPACGGGLVVPSLQS